MQRVVTNTDLGEGRIRWRVRIEGDSHDLAVKDFHKAVLLDNFANNPSLLLCGITPFDTMRMFHDGEKWIVEAEAVTEIPNAKSTRRGT